MDLTETDLELSLAIITTTPSVGPHQKCDINRKGFRKSHNQQAKKMLISSQKWKDRGGGHGFGYVTIKASKFFCKTKVDACLSNSISEESRNLIINNQECEEVNLTGLVGTNDIQQIILKTGLL